MKVLFVSHEGIDSSIFNSQVLLHAQSLKDKGIEIDILSYNTNKKTKKISLTNFNKMKLDYPEIKIMLKQGINIFFPFAAFYNSLFLILFFIQNNKKYNIIHSRSDYSTFLCCATKIFHGKKIIWDCRGDSLNELEDTLVNKNFLLKIVGFLYLKPINKFQIYLSSKFADAAIFVSESLYKKHSIRLKTTNFKIIPCPVSEKLFFFNSDIRSIYRKANNFKDNDQIFIYSGSLASYQSINLQMNFYDKILKDVRNFIIFTTTDVDLAKKLYTHKFPVRFIILNIPFSEMNNYYNMADFAILLREDKQLNNVASPTKFGEYCLSGLPVIMNDTVNQSVDFSKKIGNYHNWQSIHFDKYKDEYRQTISKKSIDFFSRKELNKKYFNLYTTLN